MENFPKFESPMDAGGDADLEKIEKPVLEDVAEHDAELEDGVHEKLKERIGTITELRSVLERTDLRGAEFVSAVDAKIEDVLERYGTAADVKLEEERALVREQEEVDKTIEKIEFDFSSPEGAGLEERRGELVDRIREINNDPDVRILRTLSSARPILKDKVRQYERFRHNPGGVEMPGRISSLRAVERETAFSSLSISFLLDDKGMEKLGYDRGMYGAHFPGTIFNVVRKSGDPEDEAESMRHENAHSIYEAFEALSGHDIAKSEAARKEFHRSLELIGLGSETIRKMQFDALADRARRVVFSSKSELIANFEELKKGRLHTELAAFYDVKKYLEATKAAYESGSVKDADGVTGIMREYLDGYLSEMQKTFDSFYSQLGDLFFIAEYEGRMDELKSAMVLFDPAEYGNIAEYFRHEIGDEKYESYKALRSLTREEFFDLPKRKIDEVVESEAEKDFNPENVVRLAGAIKATTDFLTPEVRQEILLSLDSLESKASYIAATGSSVAECEKIYGAMMELVGAIGGGEEYAESAVDNLLNSAFMNAVDGDLTKLNDALAKLSGEHDETIARFVEEYVKNDAKDDFEDPDKLKQSPLWQALVASDRTREAALRAAA